MAVRIYRAELEGGRVLWPSVRPKEWLMRVKDQMPGPMYSAQYLNDPSGLKGVRYDLDWLQYYLPGQRPSLGQLIGAQAGDPATSERESSNYFGHCTAGRDPETGIIYILGFAFGHIPSPKHIPYLREQYHYWSQRGLQINTVYLETGGPQQGTVDNLIAQTRSDGLNPLPIEAFPAKGSKESKFDTLGPWMKNGSVLFPGRQRGDFVELIENPGFQEFQTEFSSFPRGQRDDLLDAFYMIVDRLTIGGVAASVSDSEVMVDEPDVLDPIAQKQALRQAIGDSIRDAQVGQPKDRVLSESRMRMFH